MDTSSPGMSAPSLATARAAGEILGPRQQDRDLDQLLAAYSTVSTVRRLRELGKCDGG
jgi:hypothetical protein